MYRESGFIQIFLIFFAILATFIYMFLIQPHKMAGSSMNPTIHDGEYFLTNKTDRDFKRGDMVIYKNPANPDQDFFKRIIALPKDKVKIASGSVYLNGQKLKEDYLLIQDKTVGGNFIKEDQELTIPDGEYVLLGDNREHSSDSREYGFIKKDNIMGKYMMSYYK